MSIWKPEDEEKARAEANKRLFYRIGKKVSSFFWDDGPMMHGFEDREGQQDMAFEILEAMKDRKHIVIEAGVGIGKSFAYLVPLLLYNHETQKPVIIATSTIALQEQLMGDVNRLQSLLGIREDSQEVILAKGQSHYLCKKRCEEYTSDKTALLRKELASTVKQSDLGERKDFPFHIPQPIWDKVCITKYGRKYCADCKQKCRYDAIRTSLRATHGVVICNQDFLTAHLMNYDHGFRRGLITSGSEFVVIDEAHNLEDKVRSATTLRLSKGYIIGAINSANQSLAQNRRSMAQKDFDRVMNSVDGFYSCLKEQVQRQMLDTDHDMKYADRFFFQQENGAVELLSSMSKALSAFYDRVEVLASFDNISETDSSTSEDLEIISSRLKSTLSEISNYLFWLERKGGNIDFAFCPKDTSGILSDLYFGEDISTILTSATLTTSGSDKTESQYAYFVSSTGFPVDYGVLSVPKPSPFPYDEHAMIYYCDDLPHPTNEHEAFIRQGTERLLDVLEISHGKALVLFTAKTDMEEVCALLSSRDLPYKILMQKPGSSQESVLQEFKRDIDSVLLGTGAYWEGIDIQGKSLSNLVIFRLPFPVPDPIIEYKASIAKDPLMEVRVPEMIIKLKQGIGRLIRSESDTGIVSIIDPRLRDRPATPYRDIAWAVLPIHNKTSDLKELSSFYQKVVGR